MDWGVGFGVGFPVGIGTGIAVGIALGRSSGHGQAREEIEQRLRWFLGQHVVSIRTQEGQPVSHEEFVRVVMSGQSSA